MPADYHSTAEALRVSPSLDAPPSPPPWSRRHSASGPRRLSRRPSSTPNSAGAAATARRLWHAANKLNSQVLAAYNRLSPLHRVAAVVAVVVLWVLLIVMVIYSHSFFSWLAPIAKDWRESSFGWLIIFGLIVIMSFPPVFGYSTVNTIAGFVYGFPLGWPIVASACVVGSLASFLASRTVLSGYVDRMVGHDHRFKALGQVLRKEGILYLTAIRFCPLPFSLSNGFLATIPTITPTAFALSTALSSRLAILAEKNDSMTAGDKAINWLSMLIGGAIGVTVGYLIYQRTMHRAAEIAREEGDDETAAAAAEDGEAGYGDASGPLLDPEDAAAIMSDDDLSLWEAGNDSYHDWGSNDGTDTETSRK